MGNYYHLELREKSSNTDKFYRIFIEDYQVTSLWGRTGSIGQANFVSVPNGNEAHRAAHKLITAKQRKGYQLVLAGKTAPSSEAVKRPTGAKGPIGQERRKEINELIQAAHLEYCQPLFKKLKETRKLDTIIAIRGWSEWVKGWTWREEVKSLLEAKPHYHLENSDFLIVTLSSGMLEALVHNGVPFQNHGTFSYTDGTEALSPGLIETAAKLWEPNNQKSAYQGLINAFEAAQALYT